MSKCKRCVVAIVCALVSHSSCHFARAEDKTIQSGTQSAPSRDAYRSIQIIPAECAAIERQTRVFEDYFRRALTESMDFDTLRESSREWDSLIEEIRNRASKRDQLPTSMVRKEKMILPFEPFILPASEPLIPGTVDWKIWNSLLYPNGHVSKKSSPDKRIRLPQGLMNLSIPKFKRRISSRENLQKFDFSQFILPELDKPLAMPR